MVDGAHREKHAVMDAELAAFIEEIRADYPGCFACGVDNPTAKLAVSSVRRRVNGKRRPAWRPAS